MIEDKGKTPDYSAAEMVQIVYSGHTNGSGRLFGGILMEWIDTVGAVVARRHSGKEVTTAAVDTLRFEEAVPLNSTVVLIGRITYTGRTSMEVRVTTYVEYLSGVRQRVNQAYLVFVALDDAGRPSEVDPVIHDSQEDNEAFWSGERRQKLRKERRTAEY